MLLINKVAQERVMEQNLESIRQKKVFSLEVGLLIEEKDTNSCFFRVQE